MILEVTLKTFGIHRNFHAKFMQGINCIIGANRQGKTHIMEAICYAFFGKTQNSKLEKIINFDATEAEVQLVTDKYKVTRKRTNLQSLLTQTTKLALETDLNVDYSEFLSIFYISSHEQNSLFDATYLRKFLISLFKLDRYSKKYESLNAEYRGLQAVEQETKKFNLQHIKTRCDKINKYLNTQTVSKAELDIISNRLSQASFTLATKRGELNANIMAAKKRLAQVNQQQCAACGQKIDTTYKQTVYAEVEKTQEKIEKLNIILVQKDSEVKQKQERINKQLSIIENHLTKGHQLLARLQEQARTSMVRKNQQRIDDLAKVLPILNPKGFPAYLLQVYIPVITETTNNLLQTIFPDMRITIRTEKPESNQPDFKPLIHKNETTQEMSDLSGSERAVVNLCFRLGIMVIYKQLCKTSIDFMLFDESFEKLDDSNAIKILDLFNNFIEMGYLKQVFLVTHKDILKTQPNLNYIEL